MRSRPGETPQQSGRRFERFFAKLFGVEPTRGSGNLWFAKLDVGDGSITWSLKWTSKSSFSMTRELLREADRAVHENGDNSIPGVAVSVDDGAEVFVTFRASDLMRLLSTEQARYVTPTKSEQKRRIASTPSILRDED